MKPFQTSKRRPFDLKKALDGDPVVTRDGREVNIAGYNKEALRSVLGWIKNQNGGWIACQWNSNGDIVDSGPSADLFMASRTLWVRAYEFKGEVNIVWTDKEDASVFNKQVQVECKWIG